MSGAASFALRHLLIGDISTELKSESWVKAVTTRTGIDVGEANEDVPYAYLLVKTRKGRTVRVTKWNTRFEVNGFHELDQEDQRRLEDMFSRHGYQLS